MDKYIVEDNIPIPNPRGKGISKALRSLQPGQSLHLDRNLNASNNHANRVFGAGNYAVRTEGDGCRIWRLKRD